MQGIPWAELSFGVAALIVIGLIALGAYKSITAANKYVAQLMGNHINHLTESVDRGFDGLKDSMREVAESNVRLREHCIAVWTEKKIGDRNE